MDSKSIVKLIVIVAAILALVVVGITCLQELNHYIDTKPIKKQEKREQAMADSLVLLCKQIAVKNLDIKDHENYEHALDSCLSVKINYWKQKALATKTVIANWSNVKIDSLFETYQLPLPDTQHDTTYCFGPTKCKEYANAYVQQQYSQIIIDSQAIQIQVKAKEIRERDTIIGNHEQEIENLYGGIEHEKNFGKLKEQEVVSEKKHNRKNVIRKVEWATVAIASWATTAYFFIIKKQ